MNKGEIARRGDGENGRSKRSGDSAKRKWKTERQRKKLMVKGEDENLSDISPSLEGLGVGKNIGIKTKIL